MAPQASALASRYETLRMAALGEALPPEARNGLVLFLRLGMWGWARTLAVASVPPPDRRLPPGQVVPRERSACIHILAAMTMHVNQRRTP